ncbi:MAG: NAD(P)H-dependent glycerol-3-phosphate dehydrogenase [Verrucomicrobiota bacterium]
MSISIENATVLGAGSWGTGLATVLANRGLPVTIWGRDQKQADQINNKQANPHYLPDVGLPPGISATLDITEALNADLILFVVPSGPFRGIARQLAELEVREQAVLVSCTKGIELDSQKRMTEVLSEMFPKNAVGVLSGPNHAEEVARQMPTAAVIGADQSDVAQALQDVFTLPWFRTYTSDDVAGIELGGTIKNVFAIASGIAEGLGLGDNARAALVTRGLAEMMRVGVALGGRPETFQGLSGVGDLIVTCYSEHSRNFRVGRMMGKGHSPEEIERSLGMVAEGVRNTASVYQCAHQTDVRTPIIDEVHAVIYDDKPAGDALSELLSRDPRPELE